MRIAAILFAALLATPAFAADAGLAPGKPAGLRQAQQNISSTQAALVVVGIGGAIGGLGYALGSASGTGSIFAVAAVATAP